MIRKVLGATLGILVILIARGYTQQLSPAEMEQRVDSMIRQLTLE